jgi:hypothetical protein
LLLRTCAVLTSWTKLSVLVSLSKLWRMADCIESRKKVDWVWRRQTQGELPGRAHGRNGTQATPPLQPPRRDPRLHSSSAADRLAPSERRAAKSYDERPPPAHDSCRADREVEPRVVVHLEPFTNAVAGLANEMCNDTLSRWIRGRLRVPSGSKPATTKQDTPSSVRASVRNTPECGTEKNQLCPTSE